MEFPTVMNWTSPFPILGLLGGIFHFYSNLIEHSVSKQWRTWSDAAFCGVWSRFHCLPMSHKRDARLIWYILSRLFIAALWSPEVKGLSSWLLFVVFIVILLHSHLVSWDRCGTWLYRFLILAVYLTLKEGKKRNIVLLSNGKIGPFLRVLHCWTFCCSNVAHLNKMILIEYFIISNLI